MPGRDFQIVFTADTSQAATAMKGLGAEVIALERNLGSIGSGLAGVANHFADVTTQATAAGQAINKTGRASQSMFLEMAKSQAMMMGFQFAGQVIREVADNAQQARDRVKDLAIETMGLRDQMRELANLKQHEGPDNEIMADTLKMGMEAGMKPEEIRKYLEQYEGSSPAGMQKGNIDQTTKDKLAVEGAKFGVRVKLSPQTAGDLAGVISQYTDLVHDGKGGQLPPEQRVEKAMSQMGRVAYGLNEGRGNLEPLVRSLLNTAGAVVGGPVEDLGELAAIQGVASTHSNPKESGTRLRQAVRALRDTQGSASGFFRQAKIKETDTHIQRLEKIKPAIDAAKRSGRGGDVFLREQGFTDEDEMRAVLEQVEDLDITKQRIAKGKAMSGRTVMDANANFLHRDLTGIRRRQIASQAAQQHLIGTENERVQMAMENAEQQMVHEGSMAEGGVRTWGELGSDMARFGLGESERELRKRERAEKNLMAEAKRVGVPQDQIDRTMGIRTATGGEKTKASAFDSTERTRMFNALALEVERKTKDANPLGTGPNLVPKLDALIQETKETNRLLKQQGNGKPGGPQAAPIPTIPSMRAAASPKRP